MQLTGRKVFVTGGAGLIGSFLVERLLAPGPIIVDDDFSKGRCEYLAAVGDKITIREGDFKQCDVMDQALEGAEVVFHLASKVCGGWLFDRQSSCVYSDDSPCEHMSIDTEFDIAMVAWLLAPRAQLVFNESRG